MLRKCLVVTLALLVAGALLSCGEDTKTIVEPAPTGTITFNFDNNVSGAAVQFDTLLYTNARGTKYSMSMLRYVVSDVTLHRTDGRVYGMGRIHYRNEAKPETRAFTLYGVPAGTYDFVSFTFGLDEAKNVKDKYLDYPHNFQNEMFWPPAMGGDKGIGYHYMRIEGNFEDTPGGTTTGYTTHTGARWLKDGNLITGVEDPLPYHHYFRVHLPIAATTVDGDAWTVTIEMDANKWYEDPDAGDNFDSEYDWHDLGNQAIMANLDAQKKLMVNGPSCFSASIQAVP